MLRISNRQFILAIAMIFVFALSIRLVMAYQFVGLGAPPDANANSDQVDYEVLAWHLVTGEGYAIIPGKPTASRTPGTSLMLTPVYAIFGRSFAMGRVWFCLISAMTCVLAVCLGSRCFSRHVGLLAGFGLAIYPGHAYNAMHFLSETPFGFWLLLALLLTAQAMHKQRGGWGINCLAGVCWTMVIYTRPQMLLAVPIAGGLALLTLLLRHPKYLKAWAVQSIVIALLLSPWIMRNEAVLGKPTLSTITGYGLWGSHNNLTFHDPAYRGGWVRASMLEDTEHPLTGNEVQRNDQATQYGIQAIKSNTGKMPGLIVMKLWRLVNPLRDTENQLVKIGFAVGWIAVAPWILLGMIWALLRKNSAVWLLLLPIFATIACTAVFYGSDRFRDAVAPVFLVLAAAGVYRFFICMAGCDKTRSRYAKSSPASLRNDRPRPDSAAIA